MSQMRNDPHTSNLKQKSGMLVLVAEMGDPK